MKKQKADSLNVLAFRELFDKDPFADIQRYVADVAPALRHGKDTKTFVRTYIHNNSFFSDIHHQLTEFASDAFRQKVKPSYNFLSMYKDNGICPLHIDRPQCRFTIDYLIHQTSSQPWPICVSQNLTDAERDAVTNGHPTEQKEIEAIISSHSWTTIELQPNDAVLYSGTHSWHYRPIRLRGTADLVFFHFVPEDFDGPLD